MRSTSSPRLIPSLTKRCRTGGLEQLPPEEQRARGAALLEQLRSRSSADPPPRATLETLKDITAEVRTAMRAPLVLSHFSPCCFRGSHLRGDRRGTPATPCIPIRRRRAASRAPIDHMLTTFGLWLAVDGVNRHPRPRRLHRRSFRATHMVARRRWQARSAIASWSAPSPERVV